MKIQITQRLKVFIAAAALASIAFTMISFAVNLSSNNYPTHISIGNGTPPDFKFGIYDSSGAEVTSFNWSNLQTNWCYWYNYTLKQKTSLNLDVYVKWDFDCLPMQEIQMFGLWNSTEWDFGSSMLWNTTQPVPITLEVCIGATNDYSWSCNISFTVSTSAA